MKNIVIEWASFSEQGKRSEQQDCIQHVSWGNRHRFIMIDGMGGALSGAEASQLLGSVLIQEGELEDVFQQAHKTFQAWLSASYADVDRNDLPGAVGTVLELDLDTGSGKIIHLGDTRLYQTQDQSTQFAQITVDHVVPSGGVSQDFGLPTIEPQLEQITFTQDTKFVLCTDGLYEAMDDNIERDFQLFCELNDPQSIVKALINERSVDFDDNASCFVIRCLPKPQSNSSEDMQNVQPSKQKLLFIVVLSLLLGLGGAFLFDALFS